MPILKETDGVGTIAHAVVMVVLVITFSVVVVISVSRMPGADQPFMAPSASATPSATVSAVPSASATPAPEVFSPVEILPEHAIYSNGQDCVVVTSRSHTQSKGETWEIPYPFRVEAGSSDCGVFPTLQMGGWRTAYCLENNKRVPTKLYLLQSPQPVFELQVGQESFHGLSAVGQCP